MRRDEQDFFTEAEAAEYARVSVATIKRAINAGFLPTAGGLQIDDERRVNRNIIERSDLRAWIRGEQS